MQETKNIFSQNFWEIFMLPLDIITNAGNQK